MVSCGFWASFTTNVQHKFIGNICVIIFGVAGTIVIALLGIDWIIKKKKAKQQNQLDDSQNNNTNLTNNN